MYNILSSVFISKYNGFDVLITNASSMYGMKNAFSFGRTKAREYAANIEIIKEFVDVRMPSLADMRKTLTLPSGMVLSFFQCQCIAKYEKQVLEFAANKPISPIA